MAEILKLENINYSYIDGGYERQILKDLSYSFEEGKFYTVLGPSGSGKTTLLSIIAGLDTPNSGEIYDPVTKTWSHAGSELDFGTYALRYMAAGASAVGGCCTTVDQHIRQVVQAREKYLAMNRPAPIPRK